MKVALWPPKDPIEKIWVTFSYGPGLEAGETVVSVELEVTLKEGVDATPAAILDGAAQLLSGGRVVQRVQAGVAGAAYQVRCAAATSSGRVLLLAGVVPVETLV